MDKFLEILGNPTVLGYIALAVVFALFYLKGKKPDYEKYIGLVYQAANCAEKWIPDESAGNLGKLDIFLKKFTEEYQKKFGSEPTESIKDLAVAKVEELVWKRNTLKEAVNK